VTDIIALPDSPFNAIAISLNEGESRRKVV
jgi:hypothetical protein